jgi:hypothetical protein
MKFKELSLSPHLNCLSPHVANGDKVGHRCIYGVLLYSLAVVKFWFPNIRPSIGIIQTSCLLSRPTIDTKYLFNGSVDAVVPRQTVPDPVFPVGLISPAVFVNVLALAERNIFFEFAFINVTIDKSEGISRSNTVLICF